MKTKNIGYAYPSSFIAKAKGYNKVGCYFLAVYDESKPMSVKDIIVASYEKESVKSAANAYDLPYGKYSMELVLP